MATQTGSIDLKALKLSVDSVEIGGNNMLMDTDAPSLTKIAGSNNRYWSDGGVTEVVPTFVALEDAPAGITNGGRFTVETAAANKSRHLAFYNAGVVPMVDGKTYTMSMYARVVSGSTMRVRFTYGLSPFKPKEIDITNTTWERVSYTFVYKASEVGDRTGTGVRVYYGAASTYAGVVELCGYKLELGNKATDWSPATQDTSTAIDALQPELIVGTHGTTATEIWTGTSTVLNSISAGTRIQYKLSSAGKSSSASVTLNLTLKNGTTTGAKPVYFLNTTRLTTQFGINAVIDLIYDGSSWRVLNPYTNSNTVGVYGGAVIAGTTSSGESGDTIFPYSLIMKKTAGSSPTWVSIVTSGGTGTSKARYTGGLYYDDIKYMSANSTYASTKTTGTCYEGLNINFNYSSNVDSGLAIGKPVYLVGTINSTDGLFYLDATWWTQTEPSTENGKVYIYLGLAAAASTVHFIPENKVYKYYNGAFITLEEIATIEAQSTADAALEQSVEYIVGTQTAATNAWTGRTQDAALKSGKTIAYKLPYAGNSSAATLNLTLAGGETTGAKGIKINTNNSANNNVTTNFGAGSIVTMTYDGTDWRVTMYNTDTVNRVRMENKIKAAAAITQGRIICGTDAGYKNIGASVAFDLTYPLLYAGSNITTVGGTGTNNFLQLLNVNASSNGTITGGVETKTLYLKGTVSGNTFTIAASPFMTTVVPTSADGFCYIPLGVMYDATHIYFSSSSQLYAYIDGAFGQASLREASAAAKTATNYMIADEDGLMVADMRDGEQTPSTATGDNVLITNDGLHVRKGQTDRAKFLAGGMTVYGGPNSDVEIAQLGYGEGNTDTEGETADSPYYTLGIRAANSEIGNWSIAEGTDTTASGSSSHAEGKNTLASGFNSHAEGFRTTASGGPCHAEGASTTASGGGSHAEGYYSTASGRASHAEGYNTTASGENSHAEGYNTTAIGIESHAGGGGTIAKGFRQTAIGEFNVEQGRYNSRANTDYAFILGNGTDDENRSNAFAVKWDGTVDVAGNEAIDSSGVATSAKALTTTLPINKGGTNATTAAAARTQLGITPANIGAVPTTRTVNGKALSSNITLSASDVSAVPTTRTVNGKALSANITLSASDVGAVPTTRTVNGKALSSNITLDASDVDALPKSGSVSDLNDAAETGFYTFPADAANNPATTAGAVFVMTNGNYIHQLAVRNASNRTPKLYIRMGSKSGSTTTWGTWTTIV